MPKKSKNDKRKEVEKAGKVKNLLPSNNRTLASPQPTRRPSRKRRRPPRGKRMRRSKRSHEIISLL